LSNRSRKKKTVHARHVHNDRLIDALGRQAQSALNASPGPAPTTTSNATEASVTRPRRASWPTAWWASCMAV
jgi:hypothetical protein